MWRFWTVNNPKLVDSTPSKICRVTKDAEKAFYLNSNFSDLVSSIIRPFICRVTVQMSPKLICSTSISQELNFRSIIVDSSLQQFQPYFESLQ